MQQRDTSADGFLWRAVRPLVTRPKWTFSVVGLLVVLSSVFGLWLNNNLSSALSTYSARGSESYTGFQKAQDATGIDFREGLVVLVRSDAALSADAPPPASVVSVHKILAQVGGVVQVVDYSTGPDPAMISRDGHSTYVVAYVGSGNEKTISSDAQNRLNADPSLTGKVTLGGATAGNAAIAKQSTKDLGLAETVAFPVLFLLLLFSFRGVVAALLPLVTGTVTIVTALVVLMPFVATMQISVFAFELIFALGLGLSIDFSLLIVSRYREEAAVHGVGLEAVRRTVATAGRTVCFSALTVSAALLSLVVFPLSYLYSMALAGILVALSAALSGVVVLPAVLLLLGPRVNAWAPQRWRNDSERAEGSRAWYRWTVFVMRRPIPLALAAVAIMLGLGSLGGGVKFSGVDSFVLPSNTDARQVADTVTSQFPGFRAQPAISVIHAGQDAAAQVSSYADALHNIPNLTVTAPRFVGNDTWIDESFINAPPLSATAQDTIHAMRAVPTPLQHWTTGSTANFVDMKSRVGSGLPWAGLIVILASLILLFAMTGSVILPIKALAMNALTLTAAFGALVWGFQSGHLHSVLGFTSNGTLESSTPVLIGALVIGLSTDYEVFLLGRIKEAHDEGRSVRDAVAVGLEHTGRIVTLAAIGFCIAIGALTLSKIVFIKELGFGAAFAVLIDATLVRAVLVPALMLLMGRWNWWAPAPLARLRPGSATRPALVGVGAQGGDNESAAP